jgi:hypothetical protein
MQIIAIYLAASLLLHCMHACLSSRVVGRGTDGVRACLPLPPRQELPSRRGHKVSVGVRSRGPKPTSECCVSLIWMVMQGEYTSIYPGSGKGRPYVQRGYCIFLHRGACTGVTSCERGNWAQVSRKKWEYMGDRLRCWYVDCVPFLASAWCFWLVSSPLL